MNDVPVKEDLSVEALVGQVADEFTERLNRGEQPDVEEYAQRYPQIAELLRQALPALRAMAPRASELALSSASWDAQQQVTGCLGDYHLVREIGRGGMGIVYEAEQISLGRRVALKVLPFAAALDPKQLQRFRIEAQAAAHLHHTNIVPVYAVGCERGVHFYAMQYIEGQTVAALIRELRQLAGLEAADPSCSAAPASSLASELVSGRWVPAKPRGGEVVRSCAREQPTGPYPTTAPPHDLTTPPSPDVTPLIGVLSTDHSANSRAFFRTVAHLGVQAAEALEHAHTKGIIHRDIKPANLLIDVSGNLWITDFGLARMLSEAGLTMTGDLVGTLRYMSPEQALAKRVPVDHRTDIYSLGVTLYELLTLRPAYDGRDRQEVLQQIAFEEPRLPKRINKLIPAELETIIRKTISKNSAERYATAQELADDLRRFLDDKPIRAKRPTLLDWGRKWARRHQGVVATGIAGLIVAVGILTVSTLLILSAYRSEAKEHQNAVREGQSAVTALYRSLVREAEAIRRARGDGYRSKAWQRLQEALHLETPEKDVNQLRQEAVACMGDFVGLDPITWTDFPADVEAITLHPKGGLLAIGLKDGTVLLWDLGTGTATAQLQRHSSPVAALAFAPDGVRLVSGDRNATIHIWEAKVNGEWALARKIIAEPALAALIPSASFPFIMPHFVFPTLSSIAITSDSKQLAASLFFFLAGYNTSLSTIALWNLADGTRTSSFDSGRELEWTRGLAFSPDGKYLSACYLRYIGDGVSLQAQDGVLVWDLDRGRDPRDLSPDLGFAYKSDFSPDGKLLACACGEGLALFDTSNFQRQPFAPAARSRSVAFSPDSHLLAIANELLGQVRLWNVTSNREVAVLAHPGGFKDAAHAVACSRDTLVSASQRAVHKWNLAGSGEKLILTGHGKEIINFAFSPEGKLLASAGKDKVVKIWDPTTGQLLKLLNGFGAEEIAIAFSADGKMLTTGDWAGSIQFWDVASGTKLAALPDHGLGRRIFSVAFSPNGHYFAACGGGIFSGGRRGVALWRIQHGSTNLEADVGKLQPIPGPADSAVTFITFSADSQLLAWANQRNAVHVWDLEESRERPFPPVRLAHFYKCLAFEPGGKHLVFVADTGVAEAWDVATGRKAFSIGGQESKEGSEIARLGCEISLTSDGSQLAGIRGRNVCVWETASRKLSLRLPEEQGRIPSIAWSPNRELLAVGTSDGGLAIWNLARIKAQLDEIGLGW